VVGASFGGWIAAELAALYPERVGRLVLVDALGLWLDAHPWPRSSAPRRRSWPRRCSTISSTRSRRS
jgi:pimeloyl-ACP methyl ester carboxylesterase